MSERTPEERMDRANRIGKLANDPLMVEVFDLVESEALSALLNESDPAKRDLAWHRYHATKEVRNVIARFVADGQYAQAELARAAQRGG